MDLNLTKTSFHKSRKNDWEYLLKGASLDGSCKREKSKLAYYPECSRDKIKSIYDKSNTNQRINLLAKLEFVLFPD